MGLLLDTKFWADALNRLADLQPGIGQPITKKNASRICEIACNTLSAVLADPQFSVDLANAIALAKNTPLVGAKTQNFSAFLTSFMILESKILEDAGVNTVASRDLAREVHAVAGSADKADLDRLEEKIVFLRKLACNADGADDPKKPFWVAAWRGVKGGALVGMDFGSIAGTAVVLGPAGAAVAGTVSGFSIGYGAALVRDALKGYW